MVALSAQRYSLNTKAMNDNTRAAGLARHELINLSRQLQDVAVVAHMGQSPLTILMQQGSQIGDIFASSQGTVRGFFSQVRDAIASVITPARLLTGSVLAIGAAAVTAAFQWGTAQREMRMQLMGAGLASGAGLGDLNRIANSASLFDLSRSEARSFAAELASTGRIGVEMLSPLVAMGKDIARVYGEDATEAAKRLSVAFSDPSRGAEELNKRLGFLDAAMLRNIRNLQEQNRLYEAQRLLADGVSSSTAGLTRNLSSTAQFWTAIGNGLSNLWGSFGEFMARTTGVGFMEGLDEKIEKSRRKVEELGRQIERELNAPAVIRRDGRAENFSIQLERERKVLADLNLEWEQYGRSVFEARLRQQSFQTDAMLQRLSPDLARRNSLQNELSALQKLENEYAFDDAGLLFKMYGLTGDKISLMRQRLSSLTAGIKSDVERSIAGLELDRLTILARTPQQRSDIARLQFYQNMQMDPDTADAQTRRAAELTANNVLLQHARQMQDAERDRLLTATQRIDQANLELQIMGRSVVEQERARGALQLKHQLEQDALRTYGNRDAYDRKHLSALTEMLAKESAIKQMLAEQQLSRDLAFERAQIARDPVEANVASRLRSAYGDSYGSHMDGVLAQQMRFNEQLRTSRDLATDFFSGFARDLRNGVNAQEALSSALGRFADRLMDMAINNLVAQAFGGSGGGSPFGLFNAAGWFGGGGVSAGSFGGIGGGLGGLFDRGGYTGDGDPRSLAGSVHKREFVFSAPAVDRIGLDVLESMHRGLPAVPDAPAVAPIMLPSAPASAPVGRVILELSPDVAARILDEAEQGSIQITQRAIGDYDRGLDRRIDNSLPSIRRRNPYVTRKA